MVSLTGNIYKYSKASVMLFSLFLLTNAVKRTEPTMCTIAIILADILSVALSTKPIHSL